MPPFHPGLSDTEHAPPQSRNADSFAAGQPRFLPALPAGRRLLLMPRLTLPEGVQRGPLLLSADRFRIRQLTRPLGSLVDQDGIQENPYSAVLRLFWMLSIPLVQELPMLTLTKHAIHSEHRVPQGRRARRTELCTGAPGRHRHIQLGVLQFYRTLTRITKVSSTSSEVGGCRSVTHPRDAQEAW